MTVSSVADNSTLTSCLANGDVAQIQQAFAQLDKRLERIEVSLHTLIEQRSIKDWYTTEEFAKIVGKAEFTCREWCRHGRINAMKRKSGRGRFCSWAISHEELLRHQREGLLPEHRNECGLPR
jgi:hypothetical protein